MRWKFLFIKFRPDRYWWAITFLVRGVTINMGLVIFNSGYAQIFWMVCSIACYQLVAVWCMPWRHMMSNMLDIMAMTALMLESSCLLWFAKDEVNVADRKALDDDLVAFAVVFSVCILPAAAAVGSSIIYGQVAASALAAKQASINKIKKATKSMAANDDEALKKFLMKLPEWDYWFMAQSANVVQFEYLSEKSRHGYTTTSLDDSEKQARATQSASGISEAVRLDLLKEFAASQQSFSQEKVTEAPKVENEPSPPVVFEMVDPAPFENMAAAITPRIPFSPRAVPTCPACKATTPVTTPRAQ